MRNPGTGDSIIICSPTLTPELITMLMKDSVPEVCPQRQPPERREVRGIGMTDTGKQVSDGVSI